MAAAEAYFADLRQVRASGGGTGERSYYPALAGLLGTVGNALKPKVFCVLEGADQGAGHPDCALYTARQVQKGQPRYGQVPERGVVEIKGAGDDAWLTAESDQVTRYWGRYRLVLVTNLRDFVLVGGNGSGDPTKLETFRLAEDANAFWSKVEKPRAFASEVGAALGEYLARALSHRAALAEPRDLAWLLASYARDGLARVEAVGDTPSLLTVREALEEVLGIRFTGGRGDRFFRSTLIQTLFYGVFSAWVLWSREEQKKNDPLFEGPLQSAAIPVARGILAPSGTGAPSAVPAAVRPRWVAFPRPCRGNGLDIGGAGPGGPEHLLLAVRRGRGGAVLLRAVPRSL